MLRAVYTETTRCRYVKITETGHDADQTQQLVGAQFGSELLPYLRDPGRWLGGPLLVCVCAQGCHLLYVNEMLCEDLKGAN